MEQVGFEVLFKDGVSSPADHARKATEGLEHAMDHAKGIARELAGVFGIAFGVSKIMEFGKESLQYASHIKESQAQIQASLDSTGNAAGVNVEQLSEWAKTLDENSKFELDSIKTMQSQLLTFTNIHGETFEQAEQAVADLATKMGGDLTGAAVQVGKALQDPVRGIMALRRVGVNFTESQQEMIKQLVATGQSAKAQQFILHELNTEFGGSAKAAVDANVMLQFAKMSDELKESLGDLLADGLKKIIPYIKQFFNLVVDGIHWLREHKDMIIEVTKVTAIIVGTIIAWNTAMRIGTAATQAFTVVQWLLNVALDANPIGLVIAGVSALVVAFYEFEEVRRWVFVLWESIKLLGIAVWDFGVAPFKALYHAALAVHDALTFDFSGAKENIKNVVSDWTAGFDHIKEGIKNVKDAYNADYSNKTSTSAESKLGKSTAGGKSKGGAGLGELLRNTEVGGSKSTVVNITIKTLAEFNNYINKASDIKNMEKQLTEAALSAANDFNIIGNV